MQTNNITFSRFYILPVILIGMAVVLGEIFVQSALQEQSQDAHIINISGRQRMLSQKIVKIVLLMKSSKDFAEFHQRQKELKTIFIVWTESHEKLLYGNSKEKEDNTNSLGIQKMFIQLAPYQKNMEHTTEEIIWLKWKDRHKMTGMVQQLLKNEKLFLKKMNKITFQYDKESREKTDNVKVIVLWIAMITCILLLGLVLFFFMPNSKKFKNYVNTIQSKREELERANQFASRMQQDQTELIKQLKTSQEELLQNNEEMQAIQNNLEIQQIIFKMAESTAKLASYEYDLTQKTLKYSENLPKLYGLDKKVHLDLDTFTNLGHPEDSLNIRKELSLALINNQRMIEKIYRARNERKDAWHYYKFLGRIIFDDYEEPIKILGSIQDITQNTHDQLKLKKSKVRLEISEKAIRRSYEKQKQYEKELQKALGQNKAINKALDNSALVSIADLEGNIVKVNEIFCQTSGYTEEELLGEQHSIINSGHHPKEFWREMWQTISNGKTWRAEVCNRAKNGELYWVDTVINPIQDEQGKTYQYLSIRYLITDKKKNEEVITRLSLVAKETSNAVVISDTQGMITWVNKGFSKITGYELSEVLGKKPGSFLQGPATNMEHIKNIRKGLKSQKPFVQEILNYSKTGEAYWIELRITPVFDKNNELTQFIAIESDITARKRQEALITKQNKTLKSNQEILRNQKQALEVQNQELNFQKQTLLEKEEELMILNSSLNHNLEYLQQITSQLTQSIQSALMIQNALLPSEKKMRKYLGEYFLIYKPKNIVSGDFYWIHDVNNRIVVIAGDCTGHGVPGAFMTMIGSTLLNKIIRGEKNTNPAQALTRLHEQIMVTLKQRTNHNNSGMDISMITLQKDAEHTKLTFAGAKQDLLYIKDKESKISRIRGTRKSVGGFKIIKRKLKTMK